MGLYTRGKRKLYWLAFTPEPGKGQRFVPLRTNVLSQAAARAEEIIKNPFLAGIGTWEEELENWKYIAREMRTHTERTIEGTEGVARLFFNFIGKQPSKITREDARAFIQHVGAVGFAGRTPEVGEDGELLGVNSHATVITYWARMQGFFGWLMREDKRRDNPFEEGSLTGLDPSELAREDWVEMRVVDALIDACPRTDLRYVLYCGAKAGLRKDEIISSCHSWFNLDAHTLTVPSAQTVRGRRWRPKTKRKRVIPISATFHSFLTTEMSIRKDEDFVLYPEHNWKKYRWDFKRPLSKFFKAQGVKLNTHGLRHSFASNCLLQGYNLAEVASWLGDSQSTTEKIYAHLIPKAGVLTF